MRIWIARDLAVLSLLTAIVAGCSPLGEEPRAGGWVGDIRTAGDVTTVVNESGSVWGGTATLLEEASIGVESGDDPYMLGEVDGVLLLRDRIYVLDAQVPVIRVYGLDGGHLFDIGRGGEGPGEFGTGMGGPSGIARGADGLVYVHARSKIEIFGADGEHVASWPLERSMGIQQGFSLVAPASGSVILADSLRCEGIYRWRCPTGLLEINEGVVAEKLEPLPDLGYTTPRVELEMRSGQSVSVLAGVPPFVPERVWTITPSGDIVVGRADRYEIENHQRGDGTRTVFSRYWEPVPVDPEEGAWYLRLERLRAQNDRITSVSGYDLDNGLPATKPAFEQFLAGQDGTTWVVRPGRGERLRDCAPADADARTMSAAPCWRDTHLLDVFGADGRYLGEVAVPPIIMNERFKAQRFRPTPFIDGDQFLLQVEDEAGVVMVKRYRLVLPESDER